MTTGEKNKFLASNGSGQPISMSGLDAAQSKPQTPAAEA